MKKKILYLILFVVVVLLLWLLLPRPPARDEAMQQGIPVEHFAQAEDETDLFAATDGGIALDPAEIRGRNTWWVWTAGNEAFWDWLANNSFGTFDMLKTISSYPCSEEQRRRAERHEASLAAASEPGAGYSSGGSGYGESGSGYDESGSGYGGSGSGYDESGSGYGGYETAYEGTLYRDYACADAMYPDRGRPPYRHYDRSSRFCYAGLINEPGFRRPAEPDEHGLCLDQPVDPDAVFGGAAGAERERLEELYGRPSGVLGLRLFPNPNFDDAAERRWREAMAEDSFYLDPEFYFDRELVRPYRVGMSCGFCHISHHPLHPPDDPENPRWENLSGTIGAQYFWFGRVFSANVTPDNFIWHLVGAQRPGAVDTSFIPHDNLFNPRAMNAVFEVEARLGVAERIGVETSVGGARDLPEVERYLDEEGESATFPVPHVLWDGADSVGIDAALTRVYINIGEYHQQWIRTIDPIVGLRKQSPITVEAAQENSVFWNATQERAGDMALYLMRAGYRYPLAETAHGEARLRGEREEEEYLAVLERGRTVFAENCARCHSSKMPEKLVGLGEEGCIGPDYLDCWKRYWEWTETDDFKSRMTAIVRDPAFLDDNFLSNDARIPVHQPLIDFEPGGIDADASTLERYLEAARQRGLATGALETEICSAMGSNAIAGHVWDNFSSQSYKSLPSIGTLELYDPVADEVIEWEAPAGGRGYQRVPSLVGIWSTAPFLHNNELGEFTGDPSVEGRLAAFDDAIRKLLWPELRPHTVPRSDRETHLKVPLATLPRGQRMLLPLRRLVGLGFLVQEEPFPQLSVGPLPGPVGDRPGTPIGLIGNLNLSRTDADFGLLGLGGTMIGAVKALKRIERQELTPEEAASVLRELVPELLEKSACPDFVVDRGHYFGTDLPDDDKEALIELVKTL